MTAQELANSLWAYARFAYHPGRVLASFLAVMERRVEEFEGQGCTNSLWALAVLKATHSAAFVGLLQQYVHLERTSNLFGELQYNQVLQAVLLAQFEARGGRVAWRPEVDLPEDLVDRALTAWASQQTATQLSGFHLDVSEGLIRLGIPHHIEHLVARDLLSIDIAVTSSGRQIAIEVDGPFHFPVNARTPLGHTMIRRRLLRAAGWTVVSIPWYEWFAMRSWEDRLQYLAGVLSRADDTLMQQLQPTVKDLLSTEFAPGPGADTSDDEDPHEERDAADAFGLMEAASGARVYTSSSPNAARITASGSFDEGEDGPVLGYGSVSVMGGQLDDGIETGLMEVLGRNNIQLTSGAVRRLQSMGLEEVVRAIGDRRRSAHSSASHYTVSNGNPDGFDPGSSSSTENEEEFANANDDASNERRSASGSSNLNTYCPPPSMTNNNVGVGGENSNGQEALLPKPPRHRPQAAPPSTGKLQRGNRFNPRFYNSSSTWGFYTSEQASSDNEGGSISEWTRSEAPRPLRPPAGNERATKKSGKEANASEELFKRVLQDHSSLSSEAKMSEKERVKKRKCDGGNPKP